MFNQVFMANGFITGGAANITAETTINLEKADDIPWNFLTQIDITTTDPGLPAGAPGFKTIGLDDNNMFVNRSGRLAHFDISSATIAANQSPNFLGYLGNFGTLDTHFVFGAGRYVWGDTLGSYSGLSVGTTTIPSGYRALAINETQLLLTNTSADNDYQNRVFYSYNIDSSGNLTYTGNSSRLDSIPVFAAYSPFRGVATTQNDYSLGQSSVTGFASNVQQEPGWFFVDISDASITAYTTLSNDTPTRAITNTSSNYVMLSDNSNRYMFDNNANLIASGTNVYRNINTSEDIVLDYKQLDNRWYIESKEFDGVTFTNPASVIVPPLLFNQPLKLVKANNHLLIAQSSRYDYIYIYRRTKF